MLGDMLMELNQPAEASAEYRATLQKETIAATLSVASAASEASNRFQSTSCRCSLGLKVEQVNRCECCECDANL
jgi:hypothetical protein